MPGQYNVYRNVTVISRDLLSRIIADSAQHNQISFKREILQKSHDRYNILGFESTGMSLTIHSIKSYFDANMKLLDPKVRNAIFNAKSPIYTKIRDDNPTRYIQGAKVKNVMAADGCVIEGEVENSVLFRGVKIAKGAKVKNCVLMQDTVVEEGASVEYLITDKNVKVTAGKEVKGTGTFPVYVAKYQVV